MTYKKLLSLVLAITMVLSLAACTGQPEPTVPPTSAPTAPPTQPPTEPPTEPPTDPPPTPAELYAGAVEILNNITDLTMNIRMAHTLTVDGAVYEDTSTQTVTFSGYGTEEFSAAATDEMDWDGFGTVYNELFLDGMLYTTVDEDLFYKGAMTAEEYISRFAPVVLLDATLYGEITADGDVLTFSAPTAGESWIVPEFGKLEEATGTVTLNADGSIGSYTYDVTYSLGGAEIHYDIEMDISATAGEILPLDESIEYTELEFVDAVRFMDQAAGYLTQPSGVHSVSANIVESATTHAAGAIRNQSTVINSWGTGKTYMGAVDTSIFLISASGTDSYEQEERFIDKTYTIAVDGEEPTKQAGVSASMFQNYCINSMTAAFPATHYLSGCTATDLGSIFFLELTFNDDMAEALKSGVCNVFWNDPAFLDDLAEDYRTEEMTGYLSIDKNTGLPLAMGYYYEGYHTLEGDEYMISLQQDQSYDLISMEAYEAIKEEGPAEPENKATPLFYHVTGEDGQEMWLLGTIHIGDARTSYLPQAIYDAFDAADALAVEFNSEAFDEEMENNEEFADEVTSNYFYDDGTTAEDHVEDEELFRYAEMYMKATGNYHMNVPYMKISLWSNSIDNFFRRQSYGLSSTQGVDNQLIWRAQDQEKEILDVESGLFQTEMLTGFSDGLQEMLLSESVYADPYEYVLSTWELFEMWCSGDEAALIAYLNDEEETDETTEDPETPELTDEEQQYIDEYNNAMGTDRNDDMHDVAVGYLESGKVVFYAVGLAHLLAEDGLVNTLRDAGYTVELVTFE